VTVTDFLTKAYDARAGRSTSRPHAEFAAAMKADPTLLAQAHAKAAELTDGVTCKCYCSKVHREALDQALAMAS
jgi:DNA topoisomerase IB